MAEPDAPRTDETSRSGVGPSRAIVVAIAVVILLVLLGGYFLFGREHTDNPISTHGAASRETTAPGDHGGV